MVTGILRRTTRICADLGIKPVIQFTFFHLDLADHAVAVVAKDGLEEADLQRRTEIEHPEAVGWHTATRVTEAGGIIPESQWLGVSQPVDAPKFLADSDRRDVERDMRERSRRQNARH